MQNHRIDMQNYLNMSFTYIKGSQTATQIFLLPVDVFKVLLEYSPANSLKDRLSCWHAEGQN